jgi:ABC-type sugar transport system ATPase subunit/ribose/xylose/arabinose/galactoside ABC-type transport system permease subunit
MADDSTKPILTCRSISKSFASVTVLESVDFDLRAGEVYTLMGENGAGKSTLMKILAGVHRPDSGELRLYNEALDIASPLAALKLGIALIHQEPLSFPDLDVAENIFIGRGTPTTALGAVDWKTMYSRAEELLAQLGVKLDPRAKVRGLSIADQQMVELAAALSQKARLLLMDEPTAALTPEEVGDLFRIVRKLRDQGTAIVFISHRLEEVFAISDRITVLRDGKCIGTREVAQTSKDEIIQMMVGRELGNLFDKPRVEIGEPRLRVENLSSEGRFANISFEVRRGEILGVAGLVGAGRTDVAQSIFGILPKDSGTVTLDGKHVQINSPRSAIDQGIAYVPEDRARHGLLLPLSITTNTTLAELKKVSRFSWINRSRDREIADEWRDKLRIRLRDVSQPARELSGGNQQKVVLSKWLLTEPQVLLLDEPTRGIDVGAKSEVHHLIGELARQGKSILMISSDLPEVLAMSDRIIVMREGRITGRFNRDEATQEKIMNAATGQGVTPAVPLQTSAVDYQAHPVRLRKTEPSVNLQRFREVGIALFVILTYVAAGLAQHRFFNAESFRNILLYIPLIVVVAMGQMMVIISRNIDLSVGSMLAFAAIVVGGVFKTHPDFPIGFALLCALAIGAGMGLLNGILTAYLRVPAIIATLGTLTAYRGLVFIYSHGEEVARSQIPPRLVQLSQTSPIGIPWIVLFAAAIAIVTALFMRHTRTGREIFAIGSNPAAAQLRGIPVNRVLLLIFTITGGLSGIAGLMYASRFGYVNPADTGQAMELIVISAAVIGGTNVFGGSGTVLGTVLGCMFLGVVNVAMPVVGISGFWQNAIYGFAILAAASLDTLIQRRVGKTA